MKNNYKEMSMEFRKNFISYKIKAVLSHWKSIIIGTYALAFIMSASSAVGSFTTAQHYQDRENSIGIVLAPIFADNDTNGVTWNDVLNQVDKNYSK